MPSLYYVGIVHVDVAAAAAAAFQAMSSLSRLMQNNCFLARVVRTVSVNQTGSKRCFLWIRPEVTAAMKHQGKSKPYAKDCFG